MSDRMSAACIALLSGVALASTAHAQSFGDRLGRPQPTPPPTAPSWPEDPPAARGPSEVQAPQPNYRGSGRGLPPDLVLTHDGGMIRGTIVRSQPGRFVDIQLATGELERIAWSDVRFAGRAEEATLDEPSPGDAPVPPRASSSGSLPIRFAANGRITLHRVSASATMQASHGWVTVHGRSDLYERECTAPCELRLDPGFHKFGLSIDGSPVLDAGALDITRPGTLRGIHVDNAGLRAFGGVLFTISVALAGLLVPLSFARPGWVGPDGNMLIIGSVLGGTGLLLSLPFMAARSGLALRFE